MRLRTSFRGKLLLLTIVPLAVAQLVTLLAVMGTVANDVDRRARQSLLIGGTVVDEFLSSRGEQLRTSVQVLAADFGLKEAAATGDAETIRSMLQNHSQRVGADIALLLDLDGLPVASTHEFSPRQRSAFTGLVGDSDGRASRQSTELIDGTAYQVFVVPLRAPTTIGWIVLGFEIDELVLNRISALTGMDVAIIAAANAQLIVSTDLPRYVTAGPATLLPASARADEVYLVGGAEHGHLALATPFVANEAAGAGIMVVLLRSMEEAMAPYSEARRGLVLFTIVLLGCVAAAAGWVSGGIARPLRTLSNAARHMISGQYNVDVCIVSEDEVGELASSFNAMRTAIAEREQRISHQALHDPLTDLPNRSNIIQRLTPAIEHAHSAHAKISILSIRLSRMNAISSTLGHSASDELILSAARHLRVNLEPGEILGQVGSNEFVLILPNRDSDDALVCADRIGGILGAGVTLGRINITLQTETGIAVYPQHGGNAAELLRNASIARSEAELRGVAVAIFESGREEHYVRQLRIVNDLRSAFQRDEVHVWYQPKISLPDGAACGAEALVRWQHPEYGWLSPDDFIPAAEEAGTIVHLTRYVLGRAIEQCRKWQDDGYALQVSVNISARDLRDEYLPYYILQLLKEQQLPAHQLTLEVSENAVMQEIRHAAAVLECLRDIGVRLSMDDFGTGHSSLAQMKNIPLHELKIDKSFVMTLLGEKQNEAIVRTTLELAHHLDLEVVAEGVEDEATLRYLSEAGCEQAQGYFLSKPVAADQLLEWLRTRTVISYEERRNGRRPFRRNA